MPDKLAIHSPDLVNENFDKLATIFPNCVTEYADSIAINIDLLKHELNHMVVKGNKNRYLPVWPGRHEAAVTANISTIKPFFLVYLQSHFDFLIQ